MNTVRIGNALLLSTLLMIAQSGEALAQQRIYISFVWHMHQPNYWPGEDIAATSAANRYSFSVSTVHTDRTGPYTSWPKNAIGHARQNGLGRCGAQVSLTGSLMDNLDVLEANNMGFAGWRTSWQEMSTWLTDGGHPAVDLIGFGFFHPLSALIDPSDLVLQIELHRLALNRRFSSYPVSKGMFPPETAFSTRMIPALVDASVDWVVVDNVHFDRALPDYPYTSGSNLYPPNQADQQNAVTTSWVALNGIWAPSQVSAPWGYQPHRARHVDPKTGAASEIIVVPGARYEGNEDARGGFGALNYDNVLSQLAPYNTDPQHPILVVLHHDGDNYGGGTDSYYHGNFQNFVSWIDANSDRFECTTIEDYLARFPPAANDYIHVENGSWSGADNGDPEFLKWNADPEKGYSPDRHSWGVITAAGNRVRTAVALGTTPSNDQILDGANDLARGLRFLLMAEASDYWYWDRSENGIWDSHPTRASNLATAAVDPLLTSVTNEAVPPSIYPPQRQPYNPGALEWGPDLEDEALSIWSFAYDVSGLRRVELKYRYDDDGVVTDDNKVYGSRAWCSVNMSSRTLVSQTDPLPTHMSDLFEATVSNLAGHVIDYYVEAEDQLGNIAKSAIQQVYVGGTPVLPTNCGGPVPDAGVAPDATTTTDAGANADAGAQADATTMDAQSTMDAGAQEDATPYPDSGVAKEEDQSCSCRASRAPFTPFSWLRR